MYDIPEKIVGAGLIILASSTMAGFVYVGLMVSSVIPVTYPPPWLVLWAICGVVTAFCGVVLAILKDMIDG